jgi:hypothetical protein
MNDIRWFKTLIDLGQQSGNATAQSCKGLAFSRAY